MRRNFTTIFALMVIVAVTTGCVSDEVQGAKISGNIGASLGSSGENQTDSQKISWTVSIANTGVKTAKNVTAYVILPPGIVSRLDALQESIVLGIWNLKAGLDLKAMQHLTQAG